MYIYMYIGHTTSKKKYFGGTLVDFRRRDDCVST